MEIVATPEPNRHLMFFKGILPSFSTFNEYQVSDFQMGVLKLIRDIQRPQGTQPQNYCAQGPSSHTNQHPFPTYSNYGQISQPPPFISSPVQPSHHQYPHQYAGPSLQPSTSRQYIELQPSQHSQRTVVRVHPVTDWFTITGPTLSTDPARIIRSTVSTYPDDRIVWWNQHIFTILRYSVLTIFIYFTYVYLFVIYTYIIIALMYYKDRIYLVFLLNNVSKSIVTVKFCNIVK